jgi:hypothetical protein
MPLELNGTTGVQGNSGAFVAGTAVASTSGTSIDFTSIPSWVKRVTVMFSGVSTNGTSNKILQIGSGSVTTSGYSNASSFFAAASSGTANYTNGFNFYNLITAADTLSGLIIFTTIGSNTWICSGSVGSSAGTTQGITNGSIALSGTLDRVRITTVNGTDTFDAGSINILYE